MNLQRPRKLQVLDLFSGIAGFSRGLEATGGFKTVAFCEINPYCQQVLKRHWPDTPIIEDIHDVTTHTLYRRGIRRIDVITAGFPCQPFSQAGKQQGTSDERFLWPELFRVIRDIRPRYVILENVPNLLTIQSGLVFGGILYDFRQIGYDVEWQVISAAAFGAPHLRERLWIVAYPNRTRRSSTFRSRQKSLYHNIGDGAAEKRGWYKQQLRSCKIRGHVPNANSAGCLPQRFLCRNEAQKSIFGGTISRLAEYRRRYSSTIWQVEPAICRVAHGIPNRTHRIKALGNAVVPQIPQFIGECILEAQHGH